MFNKNKCILYGMSSLFYWGCSLSHALAETVEHSPLDDHDKDPGLPQMDPEYYTSQIFWILLCFLVLYVLMSKLALPQISETIEKRETMVSSDLDRASELRKETENIKTAYEKALVQADEHAQTFLNNTINELHTDIGKRTHLAAEEINKSIEESLSRLNKEKEEAMKSVNDIAEKLASDIAARFIKSAEKGA